VSEGIGSQENVPNKEGHSLCSYLKCSTSFQTRSSNEIVRYISTNSGFQNYSPAAKF
jgi:hypothetical protein